MKAVLSFCFAMTLSATAFAASYEVPVQKEELKEFAKFELGKFEKVIVGNQVSVKYVLPETLTGGNDTIELKGEIAEGSTHFTLKGSTAVADCEGIEKTECTITYGMIYIDNMKAEAAIQKISKTPGEVNLRLEVMRAFSTDPIGFIYY